MDALQALGNLRMIRNKDGEAKVHLKKVYEMIMKLKEQEGPVAKNAQEMPSIDFRMQTCRLLVELQEFKKCVKILDSIIMEEDEQVEPWYLLSFSLVRLKKYQNAWECLKNVKNLIEKQKITNQEFLEGTRELEEKIGKHIQIKAEDVQMD